LIPGSDSFLSKSLGIEAKKSPIDLLRGPGGPTKRGRQFVHRLDLFSQEVLPTKTNLQSSASILAAAATITAKSGKADVVAKILGYCMGGGSLLLYSPIAIQLLKDKNADGFSVSTWVYNVVGLVCAFAYPFKRGFPLSTYVEMIIISAQSAGILGLICFYRSLMKEYIIGMLLFCLGGGRIFSTDVTLSPQVLSSLQFIAIIICNYATVPQILLTFKTKSASWSPITALMSIIGNSVRIFTTMQLTGDILTLSGNAMGLIGNFILLFQIFIYNKKTT